MSIHLNRTLTQRSQVQFPEQQSQAKDPAFQEGGTWTCLGYVYVHGKTGWANNTLNSVYTCPAVWTPLYNYLVKPSLSFVNQSKKSFALIDSLDYCMLKWGSCSLYFGPCRIYFGLCRLYSGSRRLHFTSMFKCHLLTMSHPEAMVKGRPERLLVSMESLWR